MANIIKFAAHAKNHTLILPIMFIYVFIFLSFVLLFIFFYSSELNSIVIVTSVTPYQELEPFLQPVTRTEAEEPLTDAEAMGIKLKENSITLATEV